MNVLKPTFPFPATSIISALPGQWYGKRYECAELPLKVWFKDNAEVNLVVDESANGASVWAPAASFDPVTSPTLTGQTEWYGADNTDTLFLFE